MPGLEITDEDIRAALIALAAARAPKTFCPSEVARSLSSDWRPLMPAVRASAAELAAVGRLAVTQKGVVVNATDARGPIRLGWPAEKDQETD